jgi:1,4-dihydroxy-2-naphthoate octaprenyltransferase
MSQDAIAIAVSVVVVVGAAAILWGIGYQLGKPRGNGRIGGILSILFGPLGWIITLFLPRSQEAEIEYQLRLRRIMDPPRGTSLVDHNDREFREWLAKQNR